MGKAKAALRVILPVAMFAGMTAIIHPASAGQAVKVQVVSVQDGTTFSGADGKQLRLHGIKSLGLKERCVDADHKSWPCGVRAQQRLTQWVMGGEVYCDIRGHDKAGVQLATCWGSGVDIGREMVRSGLAKAYTPQSRFYEVDEAEAKMVGRGMWKRDAPSATALASR